MKNESTIRNQNAENSFLTFDCRHPIQNHTVIFLVASVILTDFHFFSQHTYLSNEAFVLKNFAHKKVIHSRLQPAQIRIFQDKLCLSTYYLSHFKEEASLDYAFGNFHLCQERFLIFFSSTNFLIFRLLAKKIEKKSRKKIEKNVKKKGIIFYPPEWHTIFFSRFEQKQYP